MRVLYFFILLGLFVYSFALIDPNLTLVNAPWWVQVRDPLVNFGYYHRQASTITYIIFLLLLFVSHYYFVKYFKNVSLLKLVGLVGIVLILSYPFLSHDLFSYIFDAKILTWYGDNPYTHTPANYPDDLWIRFMHWTHRSYPYGPVFLPLTLIPSFLSAGKFILNFALFKLLNVVFYAVGVYFLAKMDKKWAVMFATHPLVLIEGLVNAHNDLIAVGLGLMGLYYLQSKRSYLARIVLLLSAGIKYLTFPIVFVRDRTSSLLNLSLFLVQIALFVYLYFNGGVQPWYFLSFFLYLPIVPKVIMHLPILSVCLLVSYTPFIRFGNWDQIILKDMIIGIGFLANLISLGVTQRSFLFRLKKVVFENMKLRS